jgi:hypothetical protein
MAKKPIARVFAKNAEFSNKKALKTAFASDIL